MKIFQLSTNLSHLCKVDTKKTGLRKSWQRRSWNMLPKMLNFTNFLIDSMYSAKIEFLADVSSTLDGDLFLHTSWGKRCGYRHVYHFMAGLQKAPKKLVSDINIYKLLNHLHSLSTTKNGNKKGKQNAFFPPGIPSHLQSLAFSSEFLVFLLRHVHCLGLLRSLIIDLTKIPSKWMMKSFNRVFHGYFGGFSTTLRVDRPMWATYEAPFKASRCAVGSQHCDYKSSCPLLPN